MQKIMLPLPFCSYLFLISNIKSTVTYQASFRMLFLHIMHSPTYSMHCLSLPLFSRFEVILQVMTYPFFIPFTFSLHSLLLLQLLLFTVLFSLQRPFKNCLAIIKFSLISCVSFVLPKIFFFFFDQGVSVKFKQYLLKMCLFFFEYLEIRLVNFIKMNAHD